MTKLSSNTNKRIPSAHVNTFKLDGRNKRLPAEFYNMFKGNSFISNSTANLKGGKCFGGATKTQGGYLDLLHLAAEQVSNGSSLSSPGSSTSQEGRPCPVKKIPKVIKAKQAPQSQEPTNEISLVDILTRAREVVNKEENSLLKNKDSSCPTFENPMASMNAQVERLIVTHMVRRRMFWNRMYHGTSNDMQEVNRMSGRAA